MILGVYTFFTRSYYMYLHVHMTISYTCFFCVLFLLQLSWLFRMSAIYWSVRKSFFFSGRSLKYIETWLLLDSVLDLSWFALGNLGFVNCFVTFAYQKEMSFIFQFCQYCIRIFFDVYGRLMYDIHLIASKYILLHGRFDCWAFLFTLTVDFWPKRWVDFVESYLDVLSRQVTGCCTLLD